MTLSSQDTQPGLDLEDCRSIGKPRDALKVFFGWPSPRILAAGVGLILVVRLGLRAWTAYDLLAIVLVLRATPITEWILHKFLLHGRPKRFGPLSWDHGAGHRQHHLRPSEIQFVLLRTQDALLYPPMLAATVALGMVPLLHLMGGPALEPVLTGTVCAWVRLLQYEWNHFLFHTAYPPRTAWFRTLRANHRLHHWRNEAYWLGVTSNLGDRILRTLPAHKTAVPISPTAKTLGFDPEAADI